MAPAVVRSPAAGAPAEKRVEDPEDPSDASFCQALCMPRLYGVWLGLGNRMLVEGLLVLLTVVGMPG